MIKYLISDTICTNKSQKLIHDAANDCFKTDGTLKQTCMMFADIDTDQGMTDTIDNVNKNEAAKRRPRQLHFDEAFDCILRCVHGYAVAAAAATHDPPRRVSHFEDVSMWAGRTQRLQK